MSYHTGSFLEAQTLCNSSVSSLALVHDSDGNGDDGVDDGVGDVDR